MPLFRAGGWSPSGAALAMRTNSGRRSAAARSALIWWVQFGSRLHSAGTSSRLTVMTRQPSSEKRFTVECPIPRLAPVRIRVLRGAAVMTGTVCQDGRRRPARRSSGGRNPRHERQVDVHDRHVEIVGDLAVLQIGREHVCTPVTNTN